MSNAVTVTAAVDDAGSPVQINAPADHHIVDWYAEFPSADPTQWATSKLVVDGAGLITGAVFSPSSSDYDATVVCMPIDFPVPEIPEPPAAGQSTLVAGVVAVSHAALTSSSRVFLQRRTAGGTTAGNVYEVTSRTPGTGFTITAVILATGLTGILDTSVVDWVVVES